MSTQQQALNALSQALKLEQEGRAFYEQAAKEVADSRCQATFASLADDERMHEDMIARQLRAVESDGKFVVLPDLVVPDIDLGAKLFPPERTEVESKLGHNPTEIQALHLALDNEIQSYNLYVNAAQETTEDAGRQMYQWLAGAELTHFNLLMSNYQALVELSSWS
jgi:rubrerythrin